MRVIETRVEGRFDTASYLRRFSTKVQSEGSSVIAAWSIRLDNLLIAKSNGAQLAAFSTFEQD